MPKEQINFPAWQKTLHGLPALAGSDEGATADVDDTMFVRWNASDDGDGYIQLTFVHYEPQPWVDYEAAVAWPPGDLSASERYYGPLSRSEINRLIRVLRRARDAAYGRDE